MCWKGHRMKGGPLPGAGREAPRLQLRGSTVEGQGFALSSRNLSVHWTQDLPIISAWPMSCTLGC